MEISSDPELVFEVVNLEAGGIPVRDIEVGTPLQAEISFTFRRRILGRLILQTLSANKDLVVRLPLQLQGLVGEVQDCLDILPLIPTPLSDQAIRLN